MSGHLCCVGIISHSKTLARSDRDRAIDAATPRNERQGMILENNVKMMRQQAGNLFTLSIKTHKNIQEHHSAIDLICNRYLEMGGPRVRH